MFGVQVPPRYDQRHLAHIRSQLDALLPGRKDWPNDTYLSIRHFLSLLIASRRSWTVRFKVAGSGLWHI